MIGKRLLRWIKTVARKIGEWGADAGDLDTRTSSEPVSDKTVYLPGQASDSDYRFDSDATTLTTPTKVEEEGISPARATRPYSYTPKANWNKSKVDVDAITLTTPTSVEEEDIFPARASRPYSYIPKETNWKNSKVTVDAHNDYDKGDTSTASVGIEDEAATLKGKSAFRNMKLDDASITVDSYNKSKDSSVPSSSPSNVTASTPLPSASSKPTEADDDSDLNNRRFENANVKKSKIESGSFNTYTRSHRRQSAVFPPGFNPAFSPFEPNGFPLDTSFMNATVEDSTIISNSHNGDGYGNYGSSNSRCFEGAQVTGSHIISGSFNGNKNSFNTNTKTVRIGTWY